MEAAVCAGWAVAAPLAVSDYRAGRLRRCSLDDSQRLCPIPNSVSACTVQKASCSGRRPTCRRQSFRFSPSDPPVPLHTFAGPGSLGSSFQAGNRAFPGVTAVSRVCCSVEELPENLQKIVKGFQMVPDATQRYKQLLYYASKLKPLAPEHHIQENKVVGCVSQVWVKPTFSEDGKVYFEADSDSQLTKGLAALLVEGLSGATPAQILRIQPDFIELLGLSQKLTASRNNGFLNMLLLMQKRTLALFMEQEKRKKTEGSGSATLQRPAEVSVAQPDSVGGEAAVGLDTSKQTLGEGAEPVSASGGTNRKESVHVHNGSDARPIYTGMKNKLEAGLSPVSLEIDDESHQHAGHAGVHKGASETHFNVKIVSRAFEGMNTVKRHRSVYQLLQEEFANGLHALSLSTKTPEEAGVTVVNFTEFSLLDRRVRFFTLAADLPIFGRLPS